MTMSLKKRTKLVPTGMSYIHYITHFYFFAWIPKIEFISLFHKLASFFVFYSFFFVNPEEHLLSRLESGCRGSVNIHYKHISPTYSISLYCRGRDIHIESTICYCLLLIQGNRGCGAGPFLAGSGSWYFFHRLGLQLQLL